MHLGQVKVAEAITNLLRRETKFVPTDHSVHRNTRASDTRPAAPNVR